MANPLNGTTYIIAFELGEGGNSSQILATIKTYGTWAKITENTWAVVAISEKAVVVRDKLRPFIGTGGRLFVIKSGYESAWANPHASNEWLRKYLQN